MIVRLDESNKNNEFLRNQFSSQEEKMKSLKPELAKSKAKLENLTSNKPGVDDRFVFVPLKPTHEKVYIPHFKRNHKENDYFARLEKGRSSNVDAEISKPMSKPTARVQKNSVFVPTCHFCGVVGHIRPNCSLLRQKPKSMTRSSSRNTDWWSQKWSSVDSLVGACDEVKFPAKMKEKGIRVALANGSSMIKSVEFSISSENKKVILCV